MTTCERTWRLLPHFLLRSTGFPFDWLERLACQATAEALDELLTCEEQLAELNAETQAALRAAEDAASLGLRKQCWERISRGRAVELDGGLRMALGAGLADRLERRNSLLERRAELEAHARAIFAHEIPARRQALREIAGDARFQEAVWLSSPQMLQFGVRSYLERWRPDSRNSETRRIERQLAAYLQRFCAKNDTASFFGPLNYGDFSAPDGGPLPGPGAEHVQHREAFLAFWGVTSLAAALTNDPQVQPYLRPRRSPMLRLGHATAPSVTLGERTFAIPENLAELLEYVDGERTVQEIAAALGRPVAWVWTELERLARLRAVMLAVEVPVTVLRPLVWLCDFVRRLPAACSSRGRWRAVLEQCRDIQDRFGAAPLEERLKLLAELETLISSVADVVPRRGGGQFYTDRLLIYEECMGGMTPLALGPECERALRAQLAPALDFYAAHACAT